MFGKTKHDVISLVSLVIALYVVPVRVLAAERLVDISGTYSESGMTIRASPGAPSEYVTGRRLRTETAA
jgi:predicted permease